MGLRIVKDFLASNTCPHHLIATCRSLGGEGSRELEELAAKESCLTVIELDVNNPATFSKVAEEVDTIVKKNGLNVLVNNAGIHIRKGLEDVTVDDLVQTFATNTIGPLLLTQSFLPLLKRAASHASDKPLGWQRAAVINMSTILASISSNSSGGLYPYRSSKAALNAITKSLSVDLVKDGIIACSVHPGWVQTDMGGPNASITPEQSVQALLKLFAKLDDSFNGGFFLYDGSVINW